MQDNQAFKSGFISIIGRPNVGKSTLLNRIVGQKVAIMSDTPQTTRNKIQGVVTTDQAQMVFIDTPGIHKPKHRLNDFMLQSAYSTFNEVDIVLFMVNAEEKRGAGDNFIMERLKNIRTPKFLIINKIDKKDCVAYKKNKYNYEILVSDKEKISKKYKNMVVDKITLEELMVIMIKGDKIC